MNEEQNFKNWFYQGTVDWDVWDSWKKLISIVVDGYYEYYLVNGTVETI